MASESQTNLTEEAERQILKVAIPGSGVITMSGMAIEDAKTDQE